MNEIKEYTEKIFEDIKHTDENGNEYWEARELQHVLAYSQWRRFENAIDKAKMACKNSKINVNDHFAEVGKMVQIGSKTKKIIKICLLFNSAKWRFKKRSDIFRANLFCYSN